MKKITLCTLFLLIIGICKFESGKAQAVTKILRVVEIYNAGKTIKEEGGKLGRYLGEKTYDITHPEPKEPVVRPVKEPVVRPVKEPVSPPERTPRYSGSRARGEI